jgi:hypothetical protein
VVALRRKPLDPTPVPYAFKEVDWSSFEHNHRGAIALSSSLSQVPPSRKLSPEERRMLRQEQCGGDYGRYLSLPEDMVDRATLDDGARRAVRSAVSVLTQNPSYDLPKKEVLLGSLIKNLEITKK